jgi:hypothetical protein
MITMIMMMMMNHNTISPAHPPFLDPLLLPPHTTSPTLTKTIPTIPIIPTIPKFPRRRLPPRPRRLRHSAKSCLCPQPPPHWPLRNSKRLNITNSNSNINNNNNNSRVCWVILAAKRPSCSIRTASRALAPPSSWSARVLCLERSRRRLLRRFGRNLSPRQSMPLVWRVRGPI